VDANQRDGGVNLIFGTRIEGQWSSLQINLARPQWENLKFLIDGPGGKAQSALPTTRSSASALPAVVNDEGARCTLFVQFHNRRNSMTIMLYLFAFIAMLLTCTQSSAKGGTYRTEDQYNQQYIDSLPAEVRTSIFRRCTTPMALHTFAEYSDNLRRIVLHFERFVCNEAATYCTGSVWLHQVWVSVGGHYRLVRSYYAPN
jgi:hypothetical protein